MTDIDTVKDRWLTLAEVGDRLALKPGKVHRLIEDHHLAARRIDGKLRVPAEFIEDTRPLRDLRGTLTVLTDLGLTDDEAIEWLLTEEPQLDATPAEALRQGRRSEVRRLAQLLG